MHRADVPSQCWVPGHEADDLDSSKLYTRAHDLGKLLLVRQRGLLRRQPQPGQHDRLVCGDEVLEHGMPGVPLWFGADRSVLRPY